MLLLLGETAAGSREELQERQRMMPLLMRDAAVRERVRNTIKKKKNISFYTTTTTIYYGYVRVCIVVTA